MSISNFQVKIPKKLIEVALPLEAVNQAATAEKQPSTSGHPRSLHLWWSRKPLAAARAVIFAQLVNDPSWKWDQEHPGENPPHTLKASWAASRRRLFSIIQDLVKWENTTNETVLERARGEIRKSWQETCELNRAHPDAKELFNPNRLPRLHDPFAGGGSIPLEAQRLGLEGCASDLNPVAVLINKAMLEIPPRFSGRSPVGSVEPDGSGLYSKARWPGATGLAEDVRRYGLWMHREARRRLEHCYPAIEVSSEMARERPDLGPFVGRRFPAIAWLWARTVESPSPAYRHSRVPLASTFVLSSKAGREAYAEPVVRGDRYEFKVRVGAPTQQALGGTTAGRMAAFRCLLSCVPIGYDYIREEGIAGRLGQVLMAVVVDGPGGKIILPPTKDAESAAWAAKPAWKPDATLPEKALGFRVQGYGMRQWADLFTQRQLVTMTTFTDLVSEVRDRIASDARKAGVADDGRGLEAEGTGATAYAEAVSIYLAFAVDRMADLANSLCRWEPAGMSIKQLFGRQAIPMMWDFAESNPLGEATGSWLVALDSVVKAFTKAFGTVQGWYAGLALQADAQSQDLSHRAVVSTDPPYYDNISYADLSDFFYVWLRLSLRGVFPQLLATIEVPKDDELVATPYRHGGKEKAEAFFLDGMTKAMRKIAEQCHPCFPTSIYYAFKQSETTAATGTTSTGWDTFLEAVYRSGLALTGTWPLRTELGTRMRSLNSNTLASSIVLVCRQRPADATTISRRAFLRELDRVLPEALDQMTRGSGEDHSPIAPVDLSQAIIGPGMAVFSKYSAVLEADGTPMSVRTALQLINRFLVEDDFDADTQFCLHWFEQHGWTDGRFGEAELLSKAKGTSVEGVVNSGVLLATGGIVRLIRWADHPGEWDPRHVTRLPVWEVLHQLIRVFKKHGESGAGAILAVPNVQGKAEATRQLAYRLYTLCERAGWAEDARAYNELITSWVAIEAAAAAAGRATEQLDLFRS